MPVQRYTIDIPRPVQVYEEYSHRDEIDIGERFCDRSGGNWSASGRSPHILRSGSYGSDGVLIFSLRYVFPA